VNLEGEAGSSGPGPSLADHREVGVPGEPLEVPLNHRVGRPVAEELLRGDDDLAAVALLPLAPIGLRDAGDDSLSRLPHLAPRVHCAVPANAAFRSATSWPRARLSCSEA